MTHFECEGVDSNLIVYFMMSISDVNHLIFISKIRNTYNENMIKQLPVTGFFNRKLVFKYTNRR